MSKLIVNSSLAPTSGFTPGQTVSPLAQAIRFGNMLFVSGLGAVDHRSGEIVDTDIAAQTRLTLDNLIRVLEAAGATTKNIVKLHITLRSMVDFSAFEEAFRDHWGDEKVAWTCVGNTPNRPGINVQIDCIAMFD